MSSAKADVAIVGAGIVGLAHAYLCARAGLKVAVFERSPAASGASIRNFGMIWPIGQPAGPLHEMALRSREIWLRVLQEAGLPFADTGSLHVAYREDEAMVGREFHSKSRALGYETTWLSTRETLERTRAVRETGLIGSLWSPTELTVDPQKVIARLPLFLAERFGAKFHFNTAVTAVESGRLEAGGREFQADLIIVASGDDFQTLFAEHFRECGITRCKLQMMRTVAQPAGWQLGPSLAFGLTFSYYPTFRVCSSLEAMKERFTRETPEFGKWGIHVMVSQNSDGELIIGDSHEYGLSVDVFDKPVIHQLILDYAGEHLRVPSLEIAAYWHGVYAKHPEHTFVTFAPARGVRVVTVTTGVGMTMSFGIAEQTVREEGAAA